MLRAGWTAGACGIAWEEPWLVLEVAPAGPRASDLTLPRGRVEAKGDEPCMGSEAPDGGSSAGTPRAARSRALQRCKWYFSTPLS